MRVPPVRRLVDAFPGVVAVLAVTAYIGIFAAGLAPSPVRSDGFSYYVYLPSWVIYHDPSLEAYSRGCCDGTFPAWSGISRWPGTGRWVNPHPMGVAVLALPFFAAAHEINLFVHVPYRHSAGITSVVYLVAGLYVLKRLLRRHFTDVAVITTLAAITFGTNLFHYGTYDDLWSHVYSFFLFACLLYLVDGWSEQPTWRRCVLIGFVVGLVFLVRHANLLFALTIPLFGVVDRRSAVARARFLLAHARQLALAAAIALLVAAPQLVMYSYATGSPFANPYDAVMRQWGVGQLDFAHPHLVGTLVTLPKGALFWSPVLALSVAGFFLLRGRARAFLLPSLAVLAASSYLSACWFDWQLGASFGNRNVTDTLPLLAIPMAACYERLSAHRRLALLVGVFTALAIALSLAQMWQYWIGVMPYSDITWERYRALFLSFQR